VSDLVTIRVQQARVHARSGNVAKAVELLEQARVLARGDRKTLPPILRELIAAHRQAGNSERADLLEEELAALGPVALPEKTTLAELIPAEREARSGRGIRITLALTTVCLAIAIAVIIWIGTGKRYDPVPMSAGAATALPAAGAPSGGAASAGPAAAAPSGAKPAEGPTGLPTAGVSPSGSGTLWGIGVGAGGNGGTVGKRSPAAAGTQPAGADAGRAELVRENVGLLLHVATYQGTVNGRICRLDLPLKAGICFAIGEHVLLTNKHVVDLDRDEVSEDCGDLNMPTLTRRELLLTACFGPGPAERTKATVIYESARNDLVLVKVDRSFSRPLRLSGKEPRVAEPVFACGFRGQAPDLLNNMDAETRNQIATKAKRGSVDSVELLTPDVFEPAVTACIVSAAGRRIRGASYLQLDAKLAEGQSGGPLLTSGNEVAGMIASTPGSGGNESYEFALALPPVRAEIEKHLND
jgi:hypothetical protein